MKWLVVLLVGCAQPLNQYVEGAPMSYAARQWNEHGPCSVRCERWARENVIGVSSVGVLAMKDDKTGECVCFAPISAQETLQMQNPPSVTREEFVRLARE